MKTNRYFRIFMMALATIALGVLRLFRKFTRLYSYSAGDKDGEPHPTRRSDPSHLGINPELELDGVPIDSYERKDPIYFKPEEQYSDFDGVVTFRGDNYRSGRAHGLVPTGVDKLKIAWSIDTGKLAKGYGTGYWTGSGWTGQPLIVRWTKEQKRQMNIYPEKMRKPSLTEVIYSTMDGNVYFLDLKTGERTRDDITVGLPFKGAGALHPSMPLLFLGPGDSGPSDELYARAFIYSLTSGEKLYEYGGKDPFAPRVFHGFDSSALVHKQTDTLIQPGENGILYTMKLNSQMTPSGVTINPSEILKLRYTTNRSSEEKYWLGMEDSAVCWKNYIYIADNGGNLLCIDINTMEIVWAQDVVDDTNGSPVLSIENGTPYIYIATSLHWSASRFLKLGDVPIFKINALTGKYVWKRTYLCNTIAGVSGGIQATCALGEGNVDDLVFFPVARTPTVRGGQLVALSKETGEEVWTFDLRRYAWSSPVLVYDENDLGTLLIGDSAGTLYMIDARSGMLKDKVELGANIEATPAVFDDMLVVGTRGQKIFGVKIS